MEVNHVLFSFSFAHMYIGSSCESEKPYLIVIITVSLSQVYFSPGETIAGYKPGGGY